MLINGIKTKWHRPLACAPRRDAWATFSAEEGNGHFRNEVLDAIVSSVRKTNHLVIAHEAVVIGGVGAEIAAQVQEVALDYLDGPIVGREAMDFSLSEQEEQFRRVLRDFTARELVPRASEIDAQARFPTDLLPKLGDLGVFGTFVPSSFGGSDAGMLSYLIAVEEVSSGCASTGFTIAVTATIAFLMKVFAGDEVKKELLPRMAKGEIMGSVGITEPFAGEDLSGIQTSLTDLGDGYRLNGSKIFISNAGLSDYYAVMARMGPQKGMERLTMVGVEKGMLGFGVGKLEGKLGLRAHPTGELVFEDCIVPKKYLLGTEGGGMEVFMGVVGPAFLGCGASSVGIARAAFEKAVAYAKERYTFGQPIGGHQAVQIMIFDMATAIEASRLLLYRAGHDFDRERLNPVDAFMAKMYATEMAVGVTYKAMQIHGGYGYSVEFPLERHFRDARAHTLHMQTPELARTLGASLMLGFGPPGSDH